MLKGQPAACKPPSQWGLQWEAPVGTERQEEKRSQGIPLIPLIPLSLRQHLQQHLHLVCSSSTAVQALCGPGSPRAPQPLALVLTIASFSLSAQGWRAFSPLLDLHCPWLIPEPLHPLGNQFPALNLLCYLDTFSWLTFGWCVAVSTSGNNIPWGGSAPSPSGLGFSFQHLPRLGSACCQLFPALLSANILFVAWNCVWREHLVVEICKHHKSCSPCPFGLPCYWLEPYC